ncbi:MAG: hypothetical protein FJ135_06695 [Deltaproteobacteria bacterium]|nr:hypothetical protein [Deltaproteobacteria bacterium]
MRPGEAVMKLVCLGYHFELVGEKVRYEWQGHGDPDHAVVRPLLEFVKAHKPEVLYFLKCHCPRCGGVVFGIFNGVQRCMACYWEEQTRLYPAMAEVKH